MVESMMEVYGINCCFSKTLENQELSRPNPRFLTGGVQGILFVLVRDDAFTLKTHMMKLSAELDNQKRGV